MSVGQKTVPNYQYTKMLEERFDYYNKWQNLLQKQEEYDTQVDKLVKFNEYLERILRTQFEKHHRLIDDFDEALKLWKMDQDELEERKQKVTELELKIYHLEKKKLIDLTNEPEMIDLTSEPESEPFSIDLNEPTSDEE